MYYAPYDVRYVVKAANEEGFSTFAHIRGFREWRCMIKYLSSPPRKIVASLRPGLCLLAVDRESKIHGFAGVGKDGNFFVFGRNFSTLKPVTEPALAIGPLPPDPLPPFSGVEKFAHQFFASPDPERLRRADLKMPSATLIFLGLKESLCAQGDAVCKIVVQAYLNGEDPTALVAKVDEYIYAGADVRLLQERRKIRAVLQSVITGNPLGMVQAMATVPSTTQKMPCWDC